MVQTLPPLPLASAAHSDEHRPRQRMFCNPLRISSSDPAISTTLNCCPCRVSNPTSGSFNQYLYQNDSSGVLPSSSDTHGLRAEYGESLSSTATYLAIKCRICLLTNKEKGEKYIYTGCHCCGFLQFAHRSCLQRWIDTKGSRHCEICLGLYKLDLSEEGKRKLRMRRENSVYIEMSDGLRVHRVGRVVRPAMIIRTTTGCKNSPRSWLLTIFIIMILATTCSAALTAYTHKQMISGHTNHSTETIGLSYGLALTFLIFCGVLTLSVGCLWVCAELAIWPLGSCIPSVQDVILSEDSDLPQAIEHHA